MDGDDDHGWDGPNIRPPQASSAEEKTHRPRGSSSKRDRHVFVSNRRDERPRNSQEYNKRHPQPDSHRRHGVDLRDRLNRNQGGDRGRHRPKERRDEKGAQRRQNAPQSSQKDYNRDERDIRLQRFINADSAKQESRRDMEVRRQRRMMEKEAREAENRVKRKRDKSRDRDVDVNKKSKQERSNDQEESEVESGEEEDDDSEDSDDTESGEDSSKSEADTASEQSGATPEHNEGSNSDENAEEVDDDDSDASETGSESERKEGKKVEDQSRSPSKSPTPRRNSDDDQRMQSPERVEDVDQSPKEDDAIEARKNVQIHDFRDDLPPYLPSIFGCRNVEEFQCLNRIEEGTYGVVYRARDKRTNETVALKRLKMDREKEGFPITSLREINTLLISQHQNVVRVREIVVGSNMDKIFIVMDFVEHDMKSLMETMRQKNQVFLPGEVKCLMTQLLSAVAHLHDNWILHRDLKTSNLLLSHNGILKVGDFGLAREYGSPLKSYTAIVVTLWYRSPELLLGIKEYSTFIDVWSIGCIFGEFLLMNPLFAGKSDIEQLNKIFKLLGTPNEKIWPGYNSLPCVQKMKFVDFPIANFRNKFPREMLSDKGLNLLRQFLSYDPKQRISCEAALRHPYFDETPLAIDPSMFPTWPAKSEQGPGGAKKAASPKPPSGGGAFKKINDDDDEARLGFQLNTNQPAPAGWNLRF